MNLKPRFDWYAFDSQAISGIPVFTREIPTAPMVHILAQFDVGLHDDPPSKEGLTHFLEHHASKTSRLIPTNKDRERFKERFTKNSLNAMTGIIFVKFIASCLPEDMRFVAEHLFDLFCNPRFEEHEKEKRAILGEIREKRWKNKLIETRARERRRHLLGNHPDIRLGRPLGWTETVEQITVDDIRKWHHRWFKQPHLSLFLCGAVTEETIDRLKPALALVPEGTKEVHVYPPLTFPHSPDVKERTTHAGDIGLTNLDRATLSLTGIFPPTRVMHMHAPVIRSLLRKLLMRKLREEEGACYRVTIDDFPRPYGDEMTVEVIVLTQTLARFERIILVTLDEISSGKYRDEIEETILLVRDRTYLEEKLSEKVVSSAGAAFIRYGRIITVTEMLREISSVTPVAIEETIRDYFTEPHLYIDRLIP